MNKVAIVTGASRGIGREIAKTLAKEGIQVVANYNKSKEKAIELQEELKKENIDIDIFKADVSKRNEVRELVEYTLRKYCKIDILINNAGFGLFGEFIETDLDRELEMINVNAVAPHILTKLFLKDFVKRDSGYILNVASSAGFMAGPKLNTYYATKNYVVSLTEAIYEELRQEKSNVHISALCPGPVNTNFNKVAGGSFTVKALTPEYVAKYAVNKMFKKKLIIIPKLSMKLGVYAARVMPTKLMLKINYRIQSLKMEETD